jgi:hypothetical protein
MDTIRDRIAHACTPWEWRSRGRVLVLVGAAVAVCVAGVVLGWLRGDGLGNSTTLAVISGVALLLLFVRPALRTLRRWDEASRTS